MGTGPRSISVDFEDVRAGGDIHIGDTTINHYYGAAERSGLHAGVPPMPAHFVGREPLVAEVARRLVGGSTLALSADGLPGVGKTTLAVALAYRREVLDHFTGGVLWGALGLQPNVMEVLASWAAALGIDVAQATDPRARAELVRSAIGRRRFLLVIDDAWAPRENALLLRCGGPSCAHFLTTRDESIARAFAGVDGAVEIRELTPEDALQLLMKLAPEACAADPESAKRLVEAVGYLPLAIELMGAYLSEAENRYFREQQEAALRRIADPAERLRQACTRLGDTGDAKVTLRETIRLSLQGLPVDAVAAFHALGAFAPKPETFDLEAARAVTGASAGTLSRLLERHLLEQQDGALSLHQTIADVARDETSDDAVQAHANHYLKRVTEAGDDWQVIEAIYGQVKWSFSHISDVAQILEFTDTLGQYQSIRGLREDDWQWNERELQAARTTGNRQREAVALNNRGWLHNNLGEHNRALEFYQQALPIRRAVGDREGEAVTLNNLAIVYGVLGEHDRALEFFQQALLIERAIGDLQDEAITLNSIGVVFSILSGPDRALEYHQQALPIFRTTGARQGEATTLNNIGSVYNRLGEHVHALEYHQQALPIFRAIGDREGEATTLNYIGAVYKHLGEHVRALEYYQQALPIFRAIGDRQGEATTLNYIGAVYNHLDEHVRALEFHQQALLILRAIGDLAGEALILDTIGDIYDNLGECDHALELYRQVLPIRRAIGDRQGEAVTLNIIGIVYDSLGESERALEFYQQALPVRLAVGDRTGEAATRFNIASIYREEGRLEEAVAELRQVVELDAAVKHPDLESDRRMLAQVEAELAERDRGEA